MAHPTLDFCAGDDAMRILGYVTIGFLIVCILLAATKALSVANAMMIAVADMAQVAAPDATRSAPQPTSGPISQQQNQTDRTQEGSQKLAEEQEDLLNMLVGLARFGSFAVQPQGGCNECPRSSCHCRGCAHTRQHSVDHEQSLQTRLSRVVLSHVHDTAPKVSATRLTPTCDNRD
jgi:hypothetical protein